MEFYLPTLQFSIIWRSGFTFLSSPLAFNRSIINKSHINLKYTTWRFDIPIHCKIFFTIKLINALITSHCYHNLCCCCFFFPLLVVKALTAAAAAKSLQSCPTLCDPIDGLPPGSPVPGILQARTLEWVAISFSNAGKWKVKVKSLSRVRL